MRSLCAAATHVHQTKSHRIPHREKKNCCRKESGRMEVIVETPYCTKQYHSVLYLPYPTLNPYPVPARENTPESKPSHSFLSLERRNQQRNLSFVNPADSRSRTHVGERGKRWAELCIRAIVSTRVGISTALYILYCRQAGQIGSILTRHLILNRCYSRHVYIPEDIHLSL